MANSAQRLRAKQLLRHYLRMLAQASGVRWDDENNIEVDDLVDAMIDAAKIELAREMHGE